MNATTNTPRNRREADTLARLLRLLADGVAFTEAVWTASEQGRDLDTARLVDLHDTHTRAGHPVRLYHVHVTNDRTGRSVQMTACPATHAEACTIMGKIRKDAGRRVHLVEVAEGGAA